MNRAFFMTRIIAKKSNRRVAVNFYWRENSKNKIEIKIFTRKNTNGYLEK